MSYSLPETRKGLFAAALFALCGVILAACNGPSALGPSVHSASLAHRHPLLYPYVFDTVDTTVSTTNKVMGINQLGHIIGTYGSGTTSDPYGGFSGHAPYTKLSTFSYPNAEGTIALGVTSNLSAVGAVIRPRSLQGTWGFIIYDGVWTVTKDRKDGRKGNPGVTEFTGINNQNFVTGYYVDPTSGNNVPFEFNATANRFVGLSPDPSEVSAVASGINGHGDMVGSETLSDGSKVGWIFRNTTFYQIAVPGAVSTFANGVNFQDQVVGSYVDSSGSTHGFLVSTPIKNPQWQYPLDHPSAVGTSVITGVDNYSTVTGWYIDSGGRTHGFVATTTR
jgi:hypothetical protein